MRIQLDANEIDQAVREYVEKWNPRLKVEEAEDNVDWDNGGEHPEVVAVLVRRVPPDAAVG